MSKTNETSKLATFEHHNTLTDSELAAVVGGLTPNADENARRQQQDKAFAAANMTFGQLLAG